MKHSVIAVLSLMLPASLAAVDLKPKTVAVFDDYVREAEARIEQRASGAGKFLWMDESQDRLVLARRGETAVGHPGKSPMKSIKGGLVHHWIGGTFIPGVSLREVTDLVQDYDSHARHYGPEVEKSQLLKHQGNDFQIFYRLKKKKVVTVTLNTEHNVRYFPVDERRMHSRSLSTKVAEVKNAGKTGEREIEPGKDSGYLWRLYSYWRFEERDGGVYVELEAISLTRNIPFGVGWLVKPIVRELPRESLIGTLGNTRSALTDSDHVASRTESCVASGDC